jgi:LPXTG-motif cell wall-anchored protein
MVRLVYKSDDLRLTNTDHPTIMVIVALSGDLSTGDQAAIGVGVIAIVLSVIISALAWLLLRRRKANQVPVGVYKHNNHYVDSADTRREADGAQRYELVGRADATELPGRPNESELPSRDDAG